MTTHDIRWLTAAPLWNNGVDADVSANGAFVRPAILRFDSDSFMDDAMKMLNTAPALLKQCVAIPETWRKPMGKAELETALEPQAKLMPLLKRTRNLSASRTLKPLQKTHSQELAEVMPFKLYQPAQQRFYLLGATLVCKTAGLPDKEINPGRQEKAAFVVRRMIKGVEHAFTANANGFSWQALASGQEQGVLDAEERIPLFNLNYSTDDARKRRLLAGLVPVAKREAYLAAEVSGNAGLASPDDKSYSPLRLLFEADAVAPWRALISQAEVQSEVVSETRNSGDGTLAERTQAANETLKMVREGMQTASWYILLDFASFLQTYISKVWSKIQGDAVTLAAAENALYQKLVNLDLADFGLTASVRNALTAYPGAGSLASSLADALKRAKANETRLDAVDHPYLKQAVSDSGDNAWPEFLFPLCDPDGSSFSTTHIDQLVTLVENALPENPANLPGIEPLKIHTGKDDNNAWFVIRCVYEQPACEPLRPAVVSEATEPFQMASFFDPDAPARSVRIPMPMDISPAGLRKYQKNTSLVISDMLCGKIDKIKKVTFGDLIRSVLPWPLHKDLPDVNDSKPCGSGNGGFGMVCSLSIPIVTLVALILMIIMVTLFDIIFKWIPYLFMCLPIPGLKGKS